MTDAREIKLALFKMMTESTPELQKNFLDALNKFYDDNAEELESGNTDAKIHNIDMAIFTLGLKIV